MTDFTQSFLAEVSEYVLFTSEQPQWYGSIFRNTKEVPLYLLERSAVTITESTLLRHLFWINDDHNAFHSAESQSKLTP